MNATLLYTREHHAGNNSSSYADQFQNHLLGFNNLSFGSFARVGSGAFDENTLAFMAPANYVFKNKYMITGNVRKMAIQGLALPGHMLHSLHFQWPASLQTKVLWKKPRTGSM